jgi:hypothetical protein
LEGGRTGKEQACCFAAIWKIAEERAWKRAKDVHQEALKVREAETAKWKERKVLKKNWPAKPKCACKNTVIAAIKLSDLTENIEDNKSESLDLDVDNTGSEEDEECED